MKTAKQWMALLLAGALLMGLCSCGPAKENGEESAPLSSQASGISEENALSEEESEGVSVTDMMGRTVAVPAGAESFICIGPGCLRLYCYVADKSQLAGVEEVEKSWGEEGRPYRMALEDVDSMETIGPGGPGNAPDAEMLFAAGADVIFTTYALESSEIDELQERIMTPVVALSYGEASLFSEEVDQSLELIGQITGNEARAEELIQYFAGAKADLEARSADAEDPPTVYLGCQSHQGSHGIESTTGDYPLFDALNARNVVAEAGIHEYVSLDKEKLLEMDPDVLVIDAGGLSILQEDYASNPDFYNSLSAVQNGNVYLQMPFNYYDTNIEIALADAYYIGTVLYPEEFSDIDPAEKFDEITREMLGIDAYDRIAASYFGGYQTVTLGQ